MSSNAEHTGREGGILSGIKVLDFGWAIVGSVTGKFLADHGAEVIRVESSTRPDMTRVDRRYSKSSLTSLDDKAWFAHFNSSKRSLSIDLKNPRSHEVIHRLVEWADIVNENFTPGTLDRMGLGYDAMKQMNSKIIFMSGSLFGQTGPMAEEWGIDGTGAAISGRLNLTGWADRVPVTPSSGIFGDYVVPLMNATGIVAALIHRDRTGEGQYLDASMFEVTTQQIQPAILDWQLNGNVQQRSGNRSLAAAPHGVFPCAGEDRWCAIATATDAEFSALLEVMGSPEWGTAEWCRTLEGRKAHEDQLEQHIAEWTANRDAYELMHLLQSHGVPAGVVQRPEEFIENDPQLTAIGYTQVVDHPLLGAFPHQVPPFHFSETPAHLHPAPRMGEHNEYICTEILGMDDSEYIDLLLEDVFR